MADCGCPDAAGTCQCLVTAGAGASLTGAGTLANPYVISASAYITVEDEGTPLTARQIINFKGMAVSAADNGGSSRTDVTVSAPATSFVKKTATESVTNSTTLQNDDELVLPVVANAVYKVELALIFDGVSGSGGLKMAWTAPAGASMAWGDVNFAAAQSPGTTVSRNTGGAGVNVIQTVWGTLTTAGTAGSLQLQWAQVTANGTATRVFPGSYLEIERFS
jgi:hypothetical protein